MIRTMLQSTEAQPLEIERYVGNGHDDTYSALRAETLAACGRIAETLSARATARQATELKRWLLLVGERVANASNEGHFWGLGGSKISAEEAQLLNDVRAALRA